MKIAHFGTFDVENYGDLLFPLLLERRLGGEEVEFVHVSPVGGAPDLKDCKPAIGFEEALAGCESWDAIVFGGGALGHGESAGDLEIYRDPAIHTIAYPGLWLLPAFIAHLRGIPLVWNAPGIPGNFSEERKRQLLRWACWQADYLSVRDVQSATVLAESLVEAKVVPDTAVEVSNLWSDRELRTEIARLERREEWPQNRYLALHLTQRYADADLVALAEKIKQICGSRGAVALLIAIGGCHDDEGIARRILEHLQGHQVNIFVPDSLRSVAAAIRFSDGYVGSSLHGAITAYSLARPFLIVAPEGDSKFAGFLAHVGTQDRQVATWAAAVEVVGHWPPSKQQTEIASGQNKSVMEALEQHWATLSARLTMRRPASSLAGAQLLETVSQMPPEWFPLIPMLERSPLFAQVIEKYREPWNSVRRQLQNSAFVAAAAYRRLDLRHQKLISDVSNLQAKLSEQRKTIEKLGGQIQKQREQANALQKAIERRDRQIASDAEDRWRKDLAKLGKWSDRLLQDYQRLLKSNRWRMGCWLSLKRADEKSKEAQRLAQLIASRPRPASVGRDVAPIRASTGKAKPDAPTRPAPESSKQDASLRRGSGAQARPTISATKKLSPPLDPGGKPSAVPKEAERGGQLISIVIPVYNAHDDLIRCLESVERHSRPEHPVIVIDDASPDERIWPLLEHWTTQHQNFRAVRNESNLGYTATVNRGCELAGPGDIILLNSDTIVPAHWIEQMAACAYSRPGVATVTAISNAAGAFSVPRKNAINTLPPGWSVDQMAAFVERNSQRVRPVVPTGNGFCMYLTSAARAAVGPFDAEHFPNGYGEENDYCLRASAAGLVNLIDDATYVFHRGSASFGPAKEEISKKSRATLDELHPEYSQLIREWNQMDALDPVRGEMQRRIDAALATGIDNALPGDARLCLLFVLHEGGGGTRFTSEDLSRAVARRYRVVVLRTAVDSWSVYRYFDDAKLVSVRRYAFAEPWRVERPMTPDRVAVVREICADYQVVLAHVHHLLASGPELLTLLRRMDIPIVFSFHDFYTVCPTINLLDETHTYCAGRCTAGAGNCPLPAKWFLPPRPWLKHRYVHQHRRRMATVLELCDAWVTASEASRKVITQYFPAVDDGRLSIIEHGRDLLRLELAKAPGPGKPLRAVAFGEFSPSKGVELILDLLRRNRAAGNPIEFHLLGQKKRDFQPEVLGAVYHGPYQRDELPEHIRAIGPAVSLIPSLSPETYCHVLTESWAMGLPALVSDIGTLRERVLKHGGGWLLPVGDTEQWFAKMRGLPDDREGYAAALEEIRKIEFTTIDSMAEKYDAIYKHLLARRRATSGSQRKRV